MACRATRIEDLSHYQPSQLDEPEVTVDAELAANEGDCLTPVEAALARGWSEIVDAYLEHKLEGLNPGELIELPFFIDYFLKALSANGPVEQVLDVGCGTGWLLNKLMQLHPKLKRAFGIDISSCMIKKARSLFDRSKTTFIRGSISEHNFAKEGIAHDSLDLVISANAMDCVMDLGGALQQIYNLLKPGAFFIFSIRHPNRNNHYATGDKRNSDYPEGPYEETWAGAGGKPVVRFYRKISTWLEELAKAGFDTPSVATPFAQKSAQEMAEEIMAEAGEVSAETAQRIRSRVEEVLAIYQERPGAMIFMVRKPL